MQPLCSYNSDMGEEQPRTSITWRIPADVLEALRRIAKRNERSLNGELVQALREHVRREEARQTNRS